MRKINIIALIASVLSLILVAVSVFVPWWQISIGDPAILQANFSPVNLNFAFFSQAVTMPLIWALNLASLLTLLAGSLVMLVYSVLPNKSYSKQLLGFGYKKPLYALIIFIVELVVIYVTAKVAMNFDLPMFGSAAMKVPSTILPDAAGVSITITVMSAMQWPFVFAIVVSVLCIVARVYHKKVVSAPVTTTTTAATVLPPPPPPV
jgi:hypothetical protein